MSSSSFVLNDFGLPTWLVCFIPESGWVGGKVITHGIVGEQVQLLLL